MSTDKTLVLITGANTGLGYFAASQLAASGRYHVLLGSRDLSKAKTAIESMANDTAYPTDTSNVEPIQIDVNSDDSIASAAKQVEEKYGVLDILMLNAAISRAVGVHSDIEPNAPGDGPSLREQYQQQFDTNVSGNAVAIEAFLPLLRKSTKPGGKRIAFTGSSIGSFTASEKAANTKYYRIDRTTKTAVQMVMASYAHELEDEGFTVAASCPGYCGTNLNQFKGTRDPRDGAKVLVHVATAPGKEVHGRLTDVDGIVPW